MKLRFFGPTLCGLILCAIHVAAQVPSRACCTVVSTNGQTGIVSAKVTASGALFEFKFNTANPRALGAVRAGQAVYANFTNNQVSLDGRTACCTVTKPPQAPAAAPAPAPARAPTPAAAAAPVNAGVLANLPQVTYGDPFTGPRPSLRTTGARFDTRTVNAKVGGRELSNAVLTLRGRLGVEEAATVLPDGASRLLEMHARTLHRGELAYYVVNPRVATEWFQTHPVPPHIKPKKEENESECGTFSWEGVVDCAEDAGAAVEAEFEKWRQQAEDWWKESTDELSDLWNAGAGCFEERVLPGPSVPVRFTKTHSMTVDVERSATRGGGQGTVKGSATVAIPMEGDFQAKMTFFYIPCLPFMARPRNLTADGNLTVGQQLSIDVEATGSFEKTFTLPPTGGPQIPLYVIPIVIGDVPVAVIDVSAYIEGDMLITGNGRATGQFTVSNSHRSTFDFTCDGRGCTGHEKGSTAPTTTNESAKIQGELSVRPGIFTALQLSFDYNVLSARAGPEPYLLGTVLGCGAASATQTAGQPSTTNVNAALMADLDWGVLLRAEALAGGQRLGDRWESQAKRNAHMWFRDMAPGGSSALVPTVSTAAATASQPVSFKVRMPTCYPYTSDVTYRLTWTGGATLSAPSGCQTAAAGSATCNKFDPKTDLTFSLTWPTAGAYSLSVFLVKDEHRTFTPAPSPAQINVTVSPSGGELP